MDQAKIDLETATIQRLEAMPTDLMTAQELIWHHQEIRDAYWRRRMASRTDDQVKRGVIAP
ncbi:MAG: hypothetical protein ACHQX3_00055 [Nitrospirales bacterium]